jgi:hypothetical protein
MSDQAFAMLSGLFAQAGEDDLINLRLILKDGGAREEFFPVTEVEAARNWAIDRRMMGHVFVGVLPRTVRDGGRGAVGKARVLWVDCDSATSVAALSSFPLPPSITIRSGTGANAHAYWLLNTSVGLDEVERLNRRLADALGSDTRVADAARVMRIPGTLNHKHDRPTDCELVDSNNARYAVSDIEAELPPLAAPAVASSVAADRGECTGDGPTSAILALLDGVTGTDNGWTARCPAHNDQHPSLSIATGEDRRCLLKCHAGCPTSTVLAALGLTMEDLFADRGAHNGGQSLTELLVDIAEDTGVLLFHDSGETPYAKVPVDHHHEVWTLGSRKFKRWLRRELYRREGRMAKTDSLNEAIELLSAKADFDGPEIEVALRSSWVRDGLAYNLADPDGQVVTVRTDGWTVEVDGSASFQRRSSAQPLPIPVRGGSIDLLRPYVNVESEEDFRLLVSALVMMLRPSGPYPALIIVGQQGSAKSTMSRVLKALVDPVKAPVRSLPSSLRDLAIMADSNWVVVLDNLSQLKDAMSDAFCRLATGGGFATRALWTDDEERIFEQTRAVILNGIDAVVTRQDLLGRSIVLRLPKIGKEGRRDEATFWADFEADRPKILGALFDAASHALAHWETTTVEGLRMADFARWAAAAVPAFGWDAEALIDAYKQNLSGALKASLEGSLLAAVLMRVAASRDGLHIEGAPTEVRKALQSALTEDEAKGRDFPPNAQAMSRSLTLLAPALAEIGIEVITTTRGSGNSKSRWITIHATPTDA